jgi:hypothetical protein
MAGFKKAKAEQAALKLGMYGPQGSGKTFTALLLAEGLANLTGKRIAYVDTERGTDFYVKDVPERQLHPKAFDMDAMYTKQITEVLEAVQGLKSEEHCVVIIDSITHIWNACMNAYSGALTKAETIPFQAWGKIKKPYKELMNLLLSSPLHAIICGRQGNEFDTDTETGELKRIGVKMKAEGETPYEPHILIRMESIKNPATNKATITAFVEKDRTGVLALQTIAWPNFDNIVKPILPLLSGTQAVIESDEETSAKDAERLADQDRNKTIVSGNTAKNFKAKIALCNDGNELAAIGKEMTTEIKKQMTPEDVADVRKAFLDAQAVLGKGDKK